MTTALLSVGYRPFFALGALNTLGAMLPWLYVLSGGAAPTQGWPPSILHGHEIIYGTVVPVIAGFLLTAVPNWCGSERITGPPLLALVCAWGAGRLALVLAGLVPPPWVAVVDIAFLPVFAGVIAVPILRTKRWRNLPILAVVLALALANAAIHLGLIEQSATLLRAGVRGAADLVVLLLIIMTGRLVPLFTRNDASRRGVRLELKEHGWLEPLVLLMALVTFGWDLALPGDAGSAILALLLVPLLALRQWGWRPLATSHEPMLWVLHVGHAFIVLGFALHAFDGLRGGLLGAGALHAFTAGAMGVTMIGMITRVTLGHSGRPISADGWVLLSFGLCIAGALGRIGAAMLGAEGYTPLLLAGGGLWTLAWGIYLARHANALVGPRADAT